MKKITKKHLSLGMMVFGMLFIWSCEKFVVVDPPFTSLTGSTVFTDEATATAALLNIYQDMSISEQRPFSGEFSLAWMSGLMSDEFNSYLNDNRAEFVEKKISPQNRIVQLNWNALYEDIYRVNMVIEQMEGSSPLPSSFRVKLKGEAHFVRALMYFYLVNFWENVPLVLSTDYTYNRLLGQSTREEIYAKIIEDLSDAQVMLSEYNTATHRTRPNLYTANALLAKVYLHTQQWEKALEAASASIESGLYHLETDLNHVFLTTSQEVIWHVEPIFPNVYTWDAYRFVLIAAPTRVTISDSLLEAFGNVDNRRDKWIGKFIANGTDYYFPNKYKVRRIPNHVGAPPESFVMFRLGEQYLIRAECKAMLGDLVGAADDLNKIRNRAGLDSVELNDREALLDAIIAERRLELFTEGCNRWFDLKRLNRINAELLPIPENELILNPALTQNPGY